MCVAPVSIRIVRDERQTAEPAGLRQAGELQRELRVLPERLHEPPLAPLAGVRGLDAEAPRDAREQVVARRAASAARVVVQVPGGDERAALQVAEAQPAGGHGGPERGAEALGGGRERSVVHDVRIRR